MNKFLKSYPLYHGSETSKQGKAPLFKLLSILPGSILYMCSSGLPAFQDSTELVFSHAVPILSDKQQTVRVNDVHIMFVLILLKNFTTSLTRIQIRQVGKILTQVCCRIDLKKFSFICEFFRYYLLALTL